MAGIPTKGFLLILSCQNRYCKVASKARPRIMNICSERESVPHVTYHSLSVRQTEILQLLAENMGRVDREEILEKVWGDASYANSLALNVQITYIRRLLTDPRLSITFIKKKGYILSVEH